MRLYRKMQLSGSAFVLESTHTQPRFAVARVSYSYIFKLPVMRSLMGVVGHTNMYILEVYALWIYVGKPTHSARV